MKEDTGSLKLYVTVDSSKVVRCDWCGTLASEKWIHGYGKRALCSKDCGKASAAIVWDGNKRRIMCGLAVLLLWLVYLVLIYPSSVQYLFPFLIFVCLLEILAIYVFRDIVRTRDRIPEWSRYNQGVSSIFQLDSMPRTAECPRCAGSINLSNVKDNMVYHCESCGTTGVVEILGLGAKRYSSLNT
ncbi:MAG: hypothetical protein ACXAEE_11130 [Candidatus Thorarchaeota archaeon]|jgi:uncharacterized paraquat-inducible protein A